MLLIVADVGEEAVVVGVISIDRLLRKKYSRHPDRWRHSRTSSLARPSTN